MQGRITIRLRPPSYAVTSVLNRGNYRDWIFASEGARESFMNCLVEACQAMDWRIHAWCLMRLRPAAGK